MARVNKANFRTYRDGETVTASEFNKIKDIFPEAINHIEDTLRDGQRLVDIENVNKEQDERLDSHDEQQAQTDQHLEQLDTRCDEQDEVLADHEARITTATSENSRQDEVISNINERLREVEDNNADIKIVTVFANNIQKVETFVASEGQQEFQLKKGHYIPGQNRIQMFVDGVQQTLDDGFMEINSATIRFTEPLKAGMKVTAHYFTEEASDDLTDIMETIKEGPAILEGLIQNGESRVNEFIQSGETTINGFLSEGEREVEELVTKGENAFDTLVQRAEQVKADSILVQSTKPLPSDNCDIWFDTSEDDFLTLQDYEEARNQAFNNQMATFESRFSEIKGEKGDKGEPGVGVLESDFKDYMGDVHETLREVHKANVEYTVRTAVGEFNHLDYEGQHITATNTIEGHVKSAILCGSTKYKDVDTDEILETFEEGRNLELVSVKMPVLTTTGKNLFDGELEIGTISGSTGLPAHYENEQRSTNFIDVRNFKNLTFSITEDITDIRVYKYDKYYNYLGYNAVNVGYQKCSFSVSDEVSYIKFRIPTPVTTLNIQLEEGSVATTFEKHRTNILTCNDEVELRGIGDVKDELDLLTGELTQRIGEVVFDGSDDEKWESDNTSNLSNTNRFYTKNVIVDDAKISPSNTLNDVGLIDLPTGTSINDNEHICIVGGKVYIRKNKTECSDLSTFKNWLSSNPITVQYELATKSVKTVVLSDNVVYSYDEVTHYDGSSEDGSLVPTIAVKVPTDVQAVITDQSTTIQTLEQENQALKKTQDTLLVAQLGMMEHIATTLAESEEQPTYLKALRQLASERGLL